MDVHVRIAGYRSIEQVGLSARPVLDRQGRPRRVMTEADPADRTGVGAVLAAGTLARPAEHLRDIPHRSIARAVDGVPDRRGLRRRGGELGGETDGLMR